MEDGTYKKKWGLSSQSAIEETAQSYSTPSGHAQSAGTFYSYLDQRLSAKWTRILYYSLIVLIGFSRVYLGVHYLEDVILGWLIGIGVTYIFMRYIEDKLPDHYKETSNNIIIGLFATTLAISLIVGYLNQWGQGAQDLTTFSGLFSGLVLGIKLEEHFVNFDARSKSLGNGVVRYILGLAISFTVLFGLDILFGFIAGDESLLGFILRYIRYTSFILSATVIVPYLFVKIGLAEREN